MNDVLGIDERVSVFFFELEYGMKRNYFPENEMTFVFSLFSFFVFDVGFLRPFELNTVGLIIH